MLTRLFRSHLFPYKGLLTALLVCQVVQAAATLYLPDLNAKVIDNGVLTGDTAYIWKAGGVMLLVTGVQVCFSIAAVYVASKASMSFGRDVRNDLFHRVTAFSQREVNQIGAPSLINRITNDVQQVQLLAVMTCTIAIAAPITGVGGVIMALKEDVGLSSLLLISLPLLVLVLFLIIRQMVPRFRLMQVRIDRVNDVLREQIIGMRVVRAFVREPEERHRFEKVNTDLTATSLAAGRLMALMFPTVMLVVNCSSVLVIWFAAGRIDDGSMTIGSMVAFLTYFTLILMSIMMATFVAFQAPRAAVSAERIEEVLGTEPSVQVSASPVTDIPGSATLELRDVGFAYPGAEAPVLDGISFTSRPGRTTAVIGSTGAGKSTLLNLVPRLFDATAGTVLVDGVDVRDIEPLALWDRIGLVPQRPYLFTGDVASNLRYGSPEATEAEMWEALEIAQAADFVRAMGGLEAPITQGGGNVSGGQRQRLSIARALVRRPEIYLFDDSFSALDLATDAALRAAMRPWTLDSTVVLVAQRVSTIIDADQILVLDAGRLVGVGTHDELLESCPTYQEIVESQVRGRAAA